MEEIRRTIFTRGLNLYRGDLDEKEIGSADHRSHVAAIAKDASTVNEGLDIYASSNRYDASKTLRIERQEDSTIQFFDQHHAVLPAKHGNGLFFGLQRSDELIPSSNDRLFRELWAELKSNCMWRQR